MKTSSSKLEKSLLAAFQVFARHTPFSYCTLSYDKRHFHSNAAKLSKAIEKDFTGFLQEHLALFQTYDVIKIYYDNGQAAVTKAIRNGGADEMLDAERRRIGVRMYDDETRALAVEAVGGGFALHSDRGWHYRTPDWTEACEAAGIARSMSRKGHSPDNAACEGFFGKLKIRIVGIPESFAERRNAATPRPSPRDSVGNQADQTPRRFFPVRR